jgi:phenylacetate-CoA ligase
MPATARVMNRDSSDAAWSRILLEGGLHPANPPRGRYKWSKGEMTSGNKVYWNPFYETLSREAMEQIQLKRFRQVMDYVITYSPMYQEKFRQAGISAGDIKTFEDIRNIPLTGKDELRQAQESGDTFLYGKTLAADVTDVCTMRQTSGTTGRPVYVPDSYRSWQWRIESYAALLYMMGLRETDRVFIPFAYNVFVAFWSGHYAAEKIGCEVIPGGGLDTEARILKIREMQATALFNTPTFGLHMAEVARGMNIDPARDLKVRKMVCAGEPLPEPTRKKLEDLWNANVYNQIGTTETCGWASMCTEKRDLHVLEPYFLVEFLDPETRSRPVKPGEEGIVVITPLFFRSMPLIRFNTNDLMTLARGDCPCGRTSLRVEKISGRVDDLRKVRGVLFSPQSVEEVIRGNFPQVVEYEIVVTRPSIMDEILLRLETDAEIIGQDRERLGISLQELLKAKTNLRFDLEWCNPGHLARYTLKAQRFRDFRT